MARDPSPVVILAAKLATLRPTLPYGAHAKAATALAGIGKSARRLCVERCNGVQRWSPSEGRMRAKFTPDDEERHGRAHNRLAKRAAGILAPYGVDPTSIETDRDPRGRCLAWAFPDCDSNGFDVGKWSI